ncbi:putative serine dehydratase domain-containing protein [Ilyonectria robusta]|uniref:putative serine dehydratase domain-containing protein n=1 Tax=Ilyonectria robusta TaxID=1079257 RepID=UPI001E8DCEA4|nr:putative serine dehydratase domain-containing protein [Ilyonectria robusta]KAH8734485.1 putative serine dehydratase domain-containing protein [Ilyonectria robusta]
MAYALESKHELLQQFVGKTLHDVPTPSPLLDLAKVEVNCERMLQAIKRLDLGWRPHIKTHKTIELTRRQVGDADTTPANIVVSTILEAEKVVPLLQEYQQRGREVNVLYSFPLFPSAVDRLSSISTQLGAGGLALMIDHPDQLQHVAAIQTKTGFPPLVFMKVDMGYRRSGVVPGTTECETLIEQLLANETEGKCVFHGIYAHAGHSYETREDWKALDHLAAEFKALEEVAASIVSKLPGHTLTLSVGASPTATSLQHPDLDGKTPDSSSSSVASINRFLRDLKALGYKLEVHAGVYPTLDLQQLATHARDHTLLSASSIAISILTEVASLYPSRGPEGTTEALINAGCLALGREPCADLGSEKGQHYAGWGIVMPWGLENPAPGEGFPAKHGGWQVGKVSQEHGILRWRSEPLDEIPLKVGQRLRIWPNHSCIAGAGFDKYFVVDSRRLGKEDDIVDVWPRWNGW